MGFFMKQTYFRAGFTLIEIMVVLVILGLLASLLGPQILGRVDDARITKAKNDIGAIETALKMYKLDTGVYPTTEQGLNALIEKPEIDPIPTGWKTGGYIDASSFKDPWNNDYIYRSPGEDEENDYEIISLGADGKEGGEDENSDIKSFDLK